MGRDRTRHGPRKHRTYTFDEAARAVGVHVNTIRAWVRHHGLPALTDERPHLIRGEDLIDFRRDWKQKRKRPLGPLDMFCMKCKAPRTPDPDLIEDASDPTGPGRVRGLCPVCVTSMLRIIPRSRLAEFLAWGGHVQTGIANIKGGHQSPLKL